jgi:hypothetical protein
MSSAQGRNSLRKGWNLLPWFLLLAATSFVMHGLASYPFVNRWDIILWMAFEYFASAAILTAIFYVPAKSFKNAAILALMIICFNFYGGLWMDELATWFMPGNFFTRQIFWLPFFFLILLFTFFLFRRGVRVPDRLVFFLNTLFLALTLVEVFSFAINRFKYKAEQEKISDLENITDKTERELPDIYIIVLDEYAGIASTKAQAGFNNATFVSALRYNGFFVADSSLSNYNFTPYSIASLLQMDYLYDASTKVPIEVNYPEVFSRLFDTRTFRVLNKLGYSINTFCWYPTNADREFDNPVLRRRIRSFVNAQTLVERNWTNNLAKNAEHWDFLGVAERNLLQYKGYNHEMINQLKLSVSKKGKLPSFTFLHLMMPHFPFYYNENAWEFPVDSLKKIDRHSKDHYLGYLKFTNQQILSVVKYIDQKSVRPYSLLIVSDHGYRGWKSDGAINLIYNNFFAWKSSDRKYPLIETPVSLVNSMRYILNYELGLSLEYLPQIIQPISY